MKSIIATSLLVSALFISCKDPKKEEVLEEKPETFDLTLNMVVKQDDNFQLFYTDESTPNFDEKKSFWIPVKGAPTAQDIVFHLPEDAIPTNLRPDLGNNPKQEPMQLNSFKISYYGKTYEVKGAEVLKNFVIGEQLKYDPATSILTPNQGSASVYDPYLYPQDNLKDEIKKITQ